MTKNIEFELVVPAYNESRNLELLIETTAKAAQAQNMTPDSFSLVVVNNGSKDDSLNVLQELKKSHLRSWFRVVNVSENQGYGYGVLQGLLSTSAKTIGWSHADLQCDPINAFKALDILSNFPNQKMLVKGTRVGRNWKDVFVSRVFEALSHLVLGLGVYEVNAQPKVFDRDLLSHIKNPPKTFAFDLYVLYCAKKQKYEIKTVEVLFPPRIHGVSNWASTFLSRYKTILGMIKYIVKLAKTEGRV